MGEMGNDEEDEGEEEDGKGRQEGTEKEAEVAALKRGRKEEGNEEA